MRTLTLTLTLNPPDGRFDPLTGDRLKVELELALNRGFEADFGEDGSWLDIEVIADAYEPTVPR